MIRKSPCLSFVPYLNAHDLVVTVGQIQKIDHWAIHECGIPSLVLMENAGRAVSAAVFSQLRSLKEPRVGVFCGTGNNGGDGLVAARYLLNTGVKVTVFMLGRPAELKGDAAVNYKIFAEWGQRPIWLTERAGVMARRLEAQDLIVDAIFGVGLNREIRGLHRRVIEQLNSSARKIVAADIPSGLDGTTGIIQGVCVKAFQTVTMSLPKAGFFCGFGPEVCGEIMVADIGIPRRWLEKAGRRKCQ